ncbi:SDR family oxidoreductase [Naumannella huperziae]
MRTLITGATGLVGQHLVHALADQTDVVALSRNPDRARDLLGNRATVRTGDLAAPQTLADAFTDIDSLFLFCVPETASEVVRQAREVGVQHIVVLSAAAVTLGFDYGHHSAVEAAVKDSGLAWTMVRPGEFMANMLPIWGPMIRKDRRVRYPFADDIVGAPIHEADIADIAAISLLDPPKHAGQEYTITGPRAYTIREQIAAISRALGAEIAFEEVTREQARVILHELGGQAAETADLLLGFTDYDGAAPDDGEYSEQDYSELMKPSPTYRDLIGHDGRDYERWAGDHRNDFR